MLKMKHNLVFESLALFLGIFVSISLPVCAQTTSPFIQILNPSLVIYTTAEQARYDAIDSQDSIASKWPITLNPIQNYLIGDQLTFLNPETGVPISFTADVVSTKPNGDFYWTGGSTDGSVFRYGKFGTEHTGNMYVASTDTRYSFDNLSSSKLVLIKYLHSEEHHACSVVSEDEEGEDEVEDRSGCQGNNIRVLVLYTTAAAAITNPVTVAQKIIAETNAATIGSGLSTTDINFTLANTLLLPLFLETATDLDGDIELLAENGDVHTLRDNNYADIVILLTSDVYHEYKGYGVSMGISALNRNAYCLAEISASKDFFTGSHEIGHVIGGRHQRQTTCHSAYDDTGKPHGFTIGAENSDIMLTALNPKCNKIRVARFSSESALYLGMPTGDSDNDVAHKLKKRADNVSCFRGTPPLPVATNYEITSVDINGNEKICASSGFAFYSVSFDPFAVLPPYTILWEVSANGISSWITVGTAQTLPLTGAGSLPNPFYLRAKITDYAGKVGSDMMKITVDGSCYGEGGEDREAAKETEAKSTFFFPNPTHDILLVYPEKGIFKIILYKSDGTILKSVFLDGSGEMLSIDISNLGPGTYFAKTIGLNDSKTHKIVKL